MMNFLATNSEVPHRHLMRSNSKPLQVTSDHENRLQPANAPSPDHSGHLLTMIGVRLNT